MHFTALAGAMQVNIYPGTATSGTLLGNANINYLSPVATFHLSGVTGSSSTSGTVTVVITPVPPTSYGSTTSLFSVDSITYEWVTYTLASSLYTQCGNPKDKYEFGFNGQMKMNEIAGVGNHNSALFWEYNTRLGRRCNLDPIDQINVSNYAVFLNCPIFFSDVHGNIAGDFKNENGKTIGNDGKKDGKVYVPKTDNKGERDGNAKPVPCDGVTSKEKKEAEKFVKKNSGDKDAFDKNPDIYSKFVEIEGDPDLRQQMYKIASQDDGSGGTSPANNTEYGGAKIDGKIVEAPHGKSGDPSKESHLGIQTNPSGGNAEYSFHSHASGSKPVPSSTSTSNMGRPGQGTTWQSSESTGDVNQWTQTPSHNPSGSPAGDVQLAKEKTNYVFGRRTGRVYIYNGRGILANISDRIFSGK